mmetsp:Transcript_74087/g.176468  ORF Transcript_74087/g.176468 Transcript_74087/m.176468 type:complete len:238 (+) Transcript_74087:565-1278(+)
MLDLQGLQLLDPKRFEHSAVKHWIMQDCIDLCLQQLLHSPLKLWFQHLRLPRNPHGLLCRLCFEVLGEQPDHGRLAHAILSKHDDDLTASESASFRSQLEPARVLLAQNGILNMMHFLHQPVIKVFPHTESQRIYSESQILGGKIAIQVVVDAFADISRHGHCTVCTWCAPQAAKRVRDKLQYAQIVLHHIAVLRGGLNTALDGLRCPDSLFDVQVCRGLIKNECLSLLGQAGRSNG